MIKTIPTRKFINAGECLLLKTTHQSGFYLMETDVLPKVFGTVADAIKGNDDFVQAIRFDLSSLVGEDVTEDCAEAWLSDWHGAPDEKVPPFVEASDAFKIYCRAYEEENPGWQGADPDQQRQEWLDDEYKPRDVPVFRPRRGLPAVIRGIDLL